MVKTLKKWAPRCVAILVIAAVVGLLIYGTYIGYLRRHRVDVLSSLDEVAVTVDGEDITLKDLGFYILFEEQKIEEEALVYNPKRTKDFWNTHTNGFFLQGQARNAVMEMAVHDRIMYNEAVEAGVVLNADEKQLLEDRRTDFWGDLYEEQLDRIPGDYDSVNRTMMQIAVGEKYQMALSEKMDTSFAGLNWDGFDYEEVIKKEHSVKVNERIWNRVFLGDITLTHDDVSYLNAFDE